MKSLLSFLWPLNRTRRRVAVIIQVLLILSTALFAEVHISTSDQHSSIQDWYYVLLQWLLMAVFITITFLLRFSIKPFIGQIGLLWSSRSSKIDERQQVVRDRAFRIAHRISLLLLLGISILCFILFAPKLVVPPRSVLFWFFPFLCMIQLIVSLPVLVVAWTELDVESNEDDVVAPHPVPLGGKVLKFRGRVR